MKKLIYSILGLGLMGTASAQVVATQKDPVLDPSKTVVVKHSVAKAGQKGLVRRDAAAGYYSYANAYQEGALFGQQLTSFVTWIYPDTTLGIVYSTGEYNKIGFHVIGTVFDPKDSNFLAVGNDVYSRWTAYTVDTLGFTQFYIRNLDSVDLGAGNVEVVDTLYVQYFNSAGLDFNSYVYQSNPNKPYYFATPKRNNYSTRTLLNSAALKTDTLLLTGEWGDSISLNGENSTVFGRGISFIPNISKIQPTASGNPVTGNVFAYSLAFKPMIKSSLGDTFVNYATNSVPFKKYNLYGIRTNVGPTNHEPDLNTPFKFNTSFITNYEVRYGASLFNNLFKSYLPGSVFSRYYILPTVYHISTDNLSTNDASEVKIGGVYPNPASTNEEISVDFKLEKTAAVVATISDINGRVLFSTNAGQFNPGAATLTIPTQGLVKGLYIVSVEANGAKSAMKFVIQ